MSNLWRLKKYCHIDDIESLKWPAVLNAELSLEPTDFFERKNRNDAITSIHGETQFNVDIHTAKVIIEDTGAAEPLRLNINFAEGTLEIVGNKAYLTITLSSPDRLAPMIDWVHIHLSQLLTLELGVYCDVNAISGTIDGRKFSLSHPGLAYCILVNSCDPVDRGSSIENAFGLMHPDSTSYPRFVVSCGYYHHALRFLSPTQVDFSPLTAAPEVVLNLAKCIESIFPHTNREDLTKKLLTLGYKESEVRSQLMSIIILRNQFDVGHAKGGASDIKEIEVLRTFLMRAVKNVRALLLNVATRVKENKTTLSPLSKQMDSENRRTLRRLEDSLSQPALASPSASQIFISAKLS